MADQRFDILPDVAAEDRGLRFTPVDNSVPTALTSKQISHFNEQGYIAPLRIFDEKEVTGLREYFDDLLQRTLAMGRDSYSISSAHLEYGGVYDILCNRRIVALVSDLLGESIVGWGSHFFCKMPGDGKSVAWHQDASYWPLTPSRTITVWLAIDDADTTNACMRFLAGSHHHGHLTWRPSAPEEHNILNQTVENAERYGTPFDNCLKAGEISIHSDLLLHGSKANESDRRRCGLTLRYAPVEVRAGQGWNAKGVLLKGVDPDQYWGNPKRPLKN